MKATALGEVIERLERDFGLASNELAQALGVSPTTLARWRADETYPQHKARQTLSQLLELSRHLQETFTTPEDAVAWLHAASRYLGGLAPVDAIRVGRFDRVEAALEALDSGIFV
jgi:transcriptional regulator with XRE-family HTH domain